MLPPAVKASRAQFSLTRLLFALQQCPAYAGVLPENMTPLLRKLAHQFALPTKPSKRRSLGVPTPMAGAPTPVCVRHRLEKMHAQDLNLPRFPRAPDFEHKVTLRCIGFPRVGFGPL